jgi:hypothetical protein
VCGLGGYNDLTALAILVPRRGHTSVDFAGNIVARSKSGTGPKNAHDLIPRDIKELRRVYPKIPNSQLQHLIDVNKVMYGKKMIKLKR